MIFSINVIIAFIFEGNNKGFLFTTKIEENGDLSIYFPGQ